MNPAIDDLQIVVRQVNLACPYPPMEVSELGKLPTLVYWLARGTQQQEDRGVEHVYHLTHEEESRALVVVGRVAKIPLQIREFVGVVGKQEVRHDGQIEVAVVHESSLPVHKPNVSAVEQDVFWFQVHVARNHIRIETRVRGAHLFIPGKDFLDFARREKTCLAEPPDETVVRGDIVERFGKWRQRMKASQGARKLNQGLRFRKRHGFNKIDTALVRSV